MGVAGPGGGGVGRWGVSGLRVALRKVFVAFEVEVVVVRGDGWRGGVGSGGRGSGGGSWRDEGGVERRARRRWGGVGWEGGVRGGASRGGWGAVFLGGSGGFGDPCGGGWFKGAVSGGACAGGGGC